MKCFEDIIKLADEKILDAECLIAGGIGLMGHTI